MIGQAQPQSHWISNQQLYFVPCVVFMTLWHNDFCYLMMIHLTCMYIRTRPRAMGIKYLPQPDLSNSEWVAESALPVTCADCLGCNPVQPVSFSTKGRMIHVRKNPHCKFAVISCYLPICHFWLPPALICSNLPKFTLFTQGKCGKWVQICNIGWLRSWNTPTLPFWGKFASPFFPDACGQQSLQGCHTHCPQDP